ncbi:hypothetical protein LTR02_015866 [Friedmanniomyces endolithicus]|nr:hypothetical protein LTR94_016573 [Friedmanniomyces endolithicus]KAK0770048.1 hypothetical protein LTR59_016698 [Friedmanniomyces endolithicus]KAK0771215.1 hypothetical protein LTR38_017309 [Friedmanniomyces endolithicus]KAK0781754.1 hypothetical protein LTR75_014611 [Friedmanniomyces endolithicus]KAK0826553.1 hypothetical protein LTR03_017159 [Friedmanniomyces endolithicus]
METVIPVDATAGKRKRSPSESVPPSTAPPAKVSKSGSGNALSINYLARQAQDDLPLLNKEDTIPNLLQLLSAYSSVLDRHESLASNLGARPLGPILIKRFERCFDAPPKVVASHHKGATTSAEESGHQITWLEVIEFARSHPGQFTLSTFSEGKRVCQFYYPQKQFRVQISEEDFLFINSGRCQELIPPLPIWEDEEKEVGTCDVLEAKLKELTNLADMVAARTRQLSHRLKGRRAAILERRADGGSGTPAKIGAQQTTTAPTLASSSGFVPVNSSLEKAGGDIDTSTGSFAAVRSELLKHFESLPQNHANPRPHSRHHSTTAHADHHLPLVTKHAENLHPRDEAASSNSSLSPVPPNLPTEPLSFYVTDSIPNAQNSRAPTTGQHGPSTGGQTFTLGSTPLKHNFSRPLPPALESSQPFRPLCQAHMDGLPRGHRVLPPCDRCRRLRMDCVKNLTSCGGCTKKHARCHWRDVSREELGDLDHLMDSMENATTSYSGGAANGYVNGDAVYDDLYESDDDDSNPLEDLEALGEKEEQREKELAERAKEDEEGLRNARELARQGGETSTYALEERQDGTATRTEGGDDVGLLTPNAPDTSRAGSVILNAVQELPAHHYMGAYDQSIQHDELKPATDVPASSTTPASNALDVLKDDSSGTAELDQTSALSAGLVPLPPQTKTESLPYGTLPSSINVPSYGGFHPVNGSQMGAAWRTS